MKELHGTKDCAMDEIFGHTNLKKSYTEQVHILFVHLNKTINSYLIKQYLYIIFIIHRVYFTISLIYPNNYYECCTKVIQNK